MKYNQREIIKKCKSFSITPFKGRSGLSECLSCSRRFETRLAPWKIGSSAAHIPRVGFRLGYRRAIRVYSFAIGKTRSYLLQKEKKSFKKIVIRTRPHGQNTAVNFTTCFFTKVLICENGAPRTYM